MRDPKIDRRTVLVGSLLLGGAAFGGLHVILRTPEPVQWTPEDLVRTLRLGPEALALGRRYLEEHPDEGDGKRLIAEIANGPRPAPESPAALLDFLRRRVERDYERGLVITVEGWVLSRTEARLWALAALEESGAGRVASSDR